MKYFVFTVDEQENPHIVNQTLRYSVVDMSLASNGDVVNTPPKSKITASTILLFLKRLLPFG